MRTSLNKFVLKYILKAIKIYKLEYSDEEMDRGEIKIEGSLTYTPKIGLNGKMTYSYMGDEGLQKVNVHHISARGKGSQVAYFIIGASENPKERRNLGEVELEKGQKMIVFSHTISIF